MQFSTRTALATSIFSLLLAASNPTLAQPTEQKAATKPAAAAAAPSLKVVQTQAALRDLWVGHVFWVRNVVEASIGGNAAAAAAAEAEVVANAKQIAGAIEPFYGKPASDKLLTLLVGHYTPIKQYMEATIAGDKGKQDAASKALTENAGEIATFLSGANPNLPKEAVRGLLLAHGAHHIQQIQQFKDKKYAEEGKTWEAMKAHMYVISDAIAGALVKQFPAKF